MIIISLSVLYLFSNSFLLDEVMRLWEKEPVVLRQEQTYDFGVVLGGLVSYYDANDQIGFNRSVDRLMQALQLYRNGYIKKIILSGGDATIRQEGYKESQILKDFLIRLGFPAEDILIEPFSKNTHENAKNIMHLFSKQDKPDFIIITSAFHMRRALDCFKKEGHVPDYFVADRYSGKRKYDIDHLLAPNPGAMAAWSMLIHEMTGYLIYDIVGYI
jgi:uncharacterized SAM-binding protein YcdF (DUF218 family)